MRRGLAVQFAHQQTNDNTVCERHRIKPNRRALEATPQVRTCNNWPSLLLVALQDEGHSTLGLQARMDDGIRLGHSAVA
jgi:hypothetical protein